jgi:hypothetical protein
VVFIRWLGMFQEVEGRAPTPVAPYQVLTCFTFIQKKTKLKSRVKEAPSLVDILCTRIQTCTGPAVILRSPETCLNVAIHVHQECIFVASRQRAQARFFFSGCHFRGVAQADGDRKK